MCCSLNNAAVAKPLPTFTFTHSLSECTECPLSPRHSAVRPVLPPKRRVGVSPALVHYLRSSPSSEQPVNPLVCHCCSVCCANPTPAAHGQARQLRLPCTPSVSDQASGTLLSCFPPLSVGGPCWTVGSVGGSTPHPHLSPWGLVPQLQAFNPGHLCCPDWWNGSQKWDCVYKTAVGNILKAHDLHVVFFL